MANLLTRDQILRADDLKTEVVSVPEWGGDVCVRGLTGAERDAYESSIFVANDKGERVMDTSDMRAKLCARCIIDPEGKLMFTLRDVTLLGQKSAAALDRVFTAAQRLSGLGAKGVDEARKSSPSDPS